MFLQANMNMSFTQMFQVRGIGHLQDEDDIEDQEDDSPDKIEPEDHARSRDEEDKEYHDPGLGDNAFIDDDVDENML